MQHHHSKEGKGPPFDFNAPITCIACKIELRAAVIDAFEKGCAKYGTEFDLRKIADILAKYDVEE